METTRTLVINRLQNNKVIRIASENNLLDFSKSKIGVAVYFDDTNDLYYGFLSHLYVKHRSHEDTSVFDIRIPRDKHKARIVFTAEEEDLGKLKARMDDLT